MTGGEKRKEAAMVDRTHTMTPTPSWWTDKHTSTWDRVKGALERDWEQTKADVTKNSGQQLNQNLADTIKQSVGSEPIPPLGMKTPSNRKVAAKEAEAARANMEKESAKAAETISKAHDEIAKEHFKLGEKVGDDRKDLAAQQTKTDDKMVAAHLKAGDKIADAQDKAVGGIAKGQTKIEEAGAKRDEAIAKWHEAEQEVRYGYSVRSQYSAKDVWDDKLEGTLRGEWDALDTGRSWNVSRAGIHRGWDYAGKTL